MKNDTIWNALATVLLVLLVVILLGSAISVLWIVANVTAKIGAAIVGVVGSIILAYFKYGLDLERQRKHTLLLEKQKNYSELFASIGGFVRAKSETKEGVEARDKLTSAHLASWAFGDVDVIVATNEFMKNKDSSGLRKILEAVRRSLGQSLLPQSFKDNYDFDQLFPPQQIKTDVPGVEKMENSV